jgi:hypothetical protein
MVRRGTRSCARRSDWSNRLHSPYKKSLMESERVSEGQESASTIPSPAEACDRRHVSKWLKLSLLHVHLGMDLHKVVPLLLRKRGYIDDANTSRGICMTGLHKINEIIGEQEKQDALYHNFGGRNINWAQASEC